MPKILAATIATLLSHVSDERDIGPVARKALITAHEGGFDIKREELIREVCDNLRSIAGEEEHVGRKARILLASRIVGDVAEDLCAEL